MKKLSPIARHDQICKNSGLTRKYQVIPSENNLVPFKVALQSKTVSRLKWIVSFQQAQTTFQMRAAFYGMLQSLDPNVHLDPNKEFGKPNLAQKEIFKRAADSIIKLVNKARFGGLIPMDSVIDTSDLLGIRQQRISIEDWTTAIIPQYRSNWFENQYCYVEIWLEKADLEEVIYDTANDLGVYISCNGKEPSVSQTLSGLERIRYFGKDINYWLWLQDLDPDGARMPVSLDEHAREMANEIGVSSPRVIPIALLPNQTKGLYQLPLKKGTNLKWFTNYYNINYGVELNALTPNQLRSIVHQEILARLDYNEILRKQQEDQKNINVIQTHLQTFNP